MEETFGRKGKKNPQINNVDSFWKRSLFTALGAALHHSDLNIQKIKQNEKLSNLFTEVGQPWFRDSDGTYHKPRDRGWQVWNLTLVQATFLFYFENHPC